MRGLILLGAVPPTEGHVALVRFAARFMEAIGGTLCVVVSCPDDYPKAFDWHINLLRDAVGAVDCGTTWTGVRANDPPQPIESPLFWSYWKNVCDDNTPTHAWGGVTHYFGSEKWGARMAQEWGAQWIPFDVNRCLVTTRASDIRRTPFGDFGLTTPGTWLSLPEAVRKHYATSVCFFGQESVGKTTTSRLLGADLNLPVVPEWARPYLESLPTPEVTDERMFDIARGQGAIENCLSPGYAPVTIYDTDLLSTIGYMRRYTPDWEKSRSYQRLAQIAMRAWKPKDLYLVCAEGEFVPDPLRYGGDRRETTQEFWIKLLKEYGCRHVVLGSLTPRQAAHEARWHVEEAFRRKAPWAWFDRRDGDHAAD